MIKESEAYYVYEKVASRQFLLNSNTVFDYVTLFLAVHWEEKRKQSISSGARKNEPTWQGVDNDSKDKSFGHA